MYLIYDDVLYLSYGYGRLHSKGTMDVYTSEKAIPQEDLAVPPPARANPLHFHLRSSVYAPQQHIEILTADPVVLSGIHVQGCNSVLS